jgi:hypothetical protein
MRTAGAHSGTKDDAASTSVVYASKLHCTCLAGSYKFIDVNRSPGFDSGAASRPSDWGKCKARNLCLKG